MLDAAIVTGRTRLWATVRPWNAPSFRVLEKLGFERSHVATDDRGEVVWLARASVRRAKGERRRLPLWTRRPRSTANDEYDQADDRKQRRRLADIASLPQVLSMTLWQREGRTYSDDGTWRGVVAANEITVTVLVVPQPTWSLS